MTYQSPAFAAVLVQVSLLPTRYGRHVYVVVVGRLPNRVYRSESPVPPLIRIVKVAPPVCATRQYLALPDAPERLVTPTPLLRYGSPPPPPDAEYVPVRVTPEYGA